jgi:hypothetical protein
MQWFEGMSSAIEAGIDGVLRCRAKPVSNTL